jgi:hypothetical protein
VEESKDKKKRMDALEDTTGNNVGTSSSSKLSLDLPHVLRKEEQSRSRKTQNLSKVICST